MKQKQAAEKDFDRFLRRKALQNVFYPDRCPLCGEVIGFADACPSCTQTYHRLLLRKKRLDPSCHYFGSLTGAAAVFRYEDEARRMIHKMKYQGGKNLAYRCGNWMAKELYGCTFSKKYGIIYPDMAFAAAMAYDMLVPVPKSDNARGYNVPELLAKPVSIGTGIPVEAEALQCIRTTKHQAGLSLEERLANVAGKYAASGKVDLTGKRILLIDDVITTGATAAACTQALLSAGAVEVFAIGLASADRKRDDDAERVLPDDI